MTSMPPRLLLGRAIQTLLLTSLVGAIAFWLAAVMGIIDGGMIGTLIRQGAGTGLKLAANIMVLGVATVCVWVFLRHSLEDLGLLKKQDEWTEWRDVPDPEALTGPALGPPEPRSGERHDDRPHEQWQSAGALRSRRRQRPKVTWGTTRR